MTIYADNAATTKLDTDAFEAMKPFLTDCYSNPSQPYSFSRKAKQAIMEARNIIAECINAEPEEIIFTSGGTESDNWAIKGIVSFGDKHSTITSQIEHHAILNACALIEKFGFPVIYLPVDCNGIVSPDVLNSQISTSTKLVSIMIANNEIGTIQPIKELAQITHKNGAFFHTDAVQAVGHIPIDVRDLSIDMLSASAHKFNGPKGIGFLYKKNCDIYPLHNGGSQEFGLRAGTENVAAIIGMAVALKKNIENMKNNMEHIRHISEVFINELKKSNMDFIFNGHPEDRLPGNINISILGKDGEALLHILDLKGFCISTGSACDSVRTQISHVISAINVPEEYAKGTIRISFGKDNTVEEAFKLSAELIKVTQIM